jgi:hypothetical protein
MDDELAALAHRWQIDPERDLLAGAPSSVA